MDSQDRQQILAEKAALVEMIASLPQSSVIDRMSLEARKAKVEKALSEVPGRDVTFRLVRDDDGYAIAIAAEVNSVAWWVLRIKRGSLRNEQTAQWIVDRLNGSSEPMPKMS